MLATPQNPPLHPAVLQARGQLSTPLSYRTPLSAMKTTPVYARTRWKPFASDFNSPAVARPIAEPIDDFPLPPDSLRQSQPKARTPRIWKAKSKEKDAEKVKDKEKEAVMEPEKEIVKEADKATDKDVDMDSAPESKNTNDPVPEVRTPQPNVIRRAPSRRQRLGSFASSQTGTSVRGRSRSQSILSYSETADNDSASFRVKTEPGTSIETIEEDMSATPAQLAMTRRRAGAAQTNRRKRTAREASLADSEDLLSHAGDGQKTVVAPRFFSKMSVPIMDEINSHKHASTFTTAVKARDAEGYYDIIKRPTDLKSIQKAISAGAKVVTAAASDTPAGSPGGVGGNVQLPSNPDVMPPKVIVNSAQLEKELMRMFVNAVMFNTGEEGVVEDAREMFESVEQSVSRWRSVERSSGRMEVEETPSVVEDEVPTTKRRKL